MPTSAAAVSLPVPVTAPMIGMSFPIHAYVKVQQAGAQGLAYQAVQPGYGARPFLKKLLPHNFGILLLL